MHPDEVRDAEVAGIGAPTEQRETRPPITEPDGMSAGDALEVRQLRRRRAGHEKREAHPDHRDNEAGADGEAARRITEIRAKE